MVRAGPLRSFTVKVNSIGSAVRKILGYKHTQRLPVTIALPIVTRS